MILFEMAERDPYVPALGFDRLTGLYDPVVRITTRESAFKRRLLEQAGLAEGQRVLDLACGTGTLALSAKRRQPSAQLTGLDADPSMLERARRKAEAERVDVQFDEGRSDELPYADSSFDVVLSSLFFHHLPGDAKRRTAREIARVLRPGGELHVADWGPPGGPLTSALFLVVRLFDGFEETRDNVEGGLPGIFEGGSLTEVHERGRLRVLFGVLAFYSARRPSDYVP